MKQLKGNRERGQALILVLILLVLGALIITPLLAFMATSLLAGRANEESMLRFYAADTGIDNAIWKLIKVPADELPTEPYHLTLNSCDVEVTIPEHRQTMIDFLKAVEALPTGPGRGDYHKAAPHGTGDNPWVVVYSPLPSEPGIYDTYQIEVTFQGQGTAYLVNLGCWIWGLYGEDQEAATITGVEEGSMSLLYPRCDAYNLAFQGTAFRWEWKPAKGPEFGFDDVMIQRFTFSPTITIAEGQRFPVNVAWSAEHRDDIFITWQGKTGFDKIEAIATDPDTDKTTAVESYVFTEEFEEEVFITILTYSINP